MTEQVLMNVAGTICQKARHGSLKPLATFAMVWNHLKEFVQNTTYEVARFLRMTPRSHEALAPLPPGDVIVDSRAEDAERRARIEQHRIHMRAAIENLKDPDRLIVRFVLEGKKSDAIAVILGVTPEVVRQRMHRIVEQLKAALREESA